MTEAYLRAEAERRVGRVINGKYRVDAILGMGGMAVVYAVTHVRNHAALAIKMLHPMIGADADLKRRFLREGYASNSVGHPNVVMIVDDDTTEDGAAFIVMERLRGASLEAIAKGPMSVRAVLSVADQVLDVLAAAHAKGIVHRDIKPGNLFIARDGSVKTLDFGIARVRDSASNAALLTATGEVTGTPAFMAPEQALAKSDGIDARTDVWAVGATMFTLLSGTFVHEGESAPQMLVAAATRPARSLATVTSVPAELVALVDRALAFDKRDRFASASEMRAAVRELHRALFSGEPPSSEVLAQLVPIEPNRATAAALDTTIGPISNDAVTRRRRSWRALYVAIAVIVASSAAIVVWTLSKKHHAPAPVAAAVMSFTPSALPEVSTKPAPPDSASRAALVPDAATPAPPAKTSGRVRGHATARPNCDPPFRFDAAGNKVFLEECL